MFSTFMTLFFLEVQKHAQMLERRRHIKISLGCDTNSCL